MLVTLRLKLFISLISNCQLALDFSNTHISFKHLNAITASRKLTFLLAKISYTQTGERFPQEDLCLSLLQHCAQHFLLPFPQKCVNQLCKIKYSCNMELHSFYQYISQRYKLFSVNSHHQWCIHNKLTLQFVSYKESMTFESFFQKKNCCKKISN